MAFPRQEYWSGLPFPFPGDLLDSGIEPGSPALAGGFFTTESSEKPRKRVSIIWILISIPSLACKFQCMLNRSVVFDSLQLYGLQPSMLFCPWDSAGKNTGVGCHSLLQWIFPTQGLNPCLLCVLHWQAGSLPRMPPGKWISVEKPEWSISPFSSVWSPPSPWCLRQGLPQTAASGGCSSACGTSPPWRWNHPRSSQTLQSNLKKTTDTKVLSLARHLLWWFSRPRVLGWYSLSSPRTQSNQFP